jgi:alanine-glyoxylate transaminase/serine-glyoxylate transaminase/serine-pyruvate transaminase
LGHLDPQFLQIMNETQEMLRQVYRTANRLTIPISATGMAGMETCVVNLIEPGDRAVVCAKGFFGQRMVEVAGRAGAAVTVLEKPWGQVFDLDQVRDALKRVRPKVLGIVQAETSTGAWQPVEQLGKLCHEFDALLIVDAVTSLGCVPVEVDKWELDAVYSCTQKGLGAPSGMAPITFSARARERARSRSFYFDLGLLEAYWSGRKYHHTISAPLVYAVREALVAVEEETLEARWNRHRRHHMVLAAGLGAMGLELLPPEGERLWTLNAVCVPDGVDEAAVRKYLLQQFNLEIGAGLGPLAGRIWRVGLMGSGSSSQLILLFLSALERALRAQGVAVSPGTGTAAAGDALSSLTTA